MAPKKGKLVGQQDSTEPPPPSSEAYVALQCQLASLRVRDEKWQERLQVIATKKQTLILAKDAILAESKDKQRTIDRILAEFYQMLDYPPDPAREKNSPKNKIAMRAKKDDLVQPHLTEDDKMRGIMVEQLRRIFARGPSKKPPQGSASSKRRASPRPLSTEMVSRPQSALLKLDAEACAPSVAKTKAEDDDLQFPECLDPLILSRTCELREMRWREEQALLLCAENLERLQKRLKDLLHLEEVNKYALDAVKFEMNPVLRAMEEEERRWAFQFACNKAFSLQLPAIQTIADRTQKLTSKGR